MTSEAKKYQVELYVFNRMTGERETIKFDEITACSVDDAINIARIKATPQLTSSQHFVGSGTQAK